MNNTVNHKELWDEVLKRYHSYIYENVHYRNGQAMFNALYDIDPDLADKLRASPVDCFHQDRLIPEFIGAIFINWLGDK